jgi:hypothetical protein
MVKNALKIWMRRFNNAAFRQKFPWLTFIELKKRKGLEIRTVISLCYQSTVLCWWIVKTL